MNQQFEILNKFKGFGNPNGKIWFVGLEEAANFETNLDNIVKEYTNETLPFLKGSIQKDSSSNGKKYTKVYDVMSKIMVGLSHSQNTDWKTYRNEYLLTGTSNEFQMNLYPLGKKNFKIWPPCYQEIFNFHDKQDYINTVKTERFPILYNFWLSHKPFFTICFGIGNYEDFITLFKLNKSKYLNEVGGYLFSEEKIIITPFFSNRNMGSERIKQTVITIQKFLNEQNGLNL